MEEEQIKIPKGVTADYFFIGLVIIFLTLLFVKNVFLMVPILLFGTLISLSIKGVIIDTNKRKIKNYLSFLIFKIGFWKSISEYKHVVLFLNNNSQTMNSRGSSTTVKIKSYSVQLRSPDKKIELKEYINYNEAKELLTYVADKLSLSPINKVMEKRSEN